MKNIIIFSALIVAVVFLLIPQQKKQTLHDIVLGPNHIDTRCYAQKELVEDGEAYSYQFARFDFYDDNSVKGNLGYVPYNQAYRGGDFLGVHKRDSGVITGVYILDTEGELVQEERFFKLNDVGLTFGFGDMELDEQNVYRFVDTQNIQYDYPLPLISCQRYNMWYIESFNV